MRSFHILILLLGRALANSHHPPPNGMCPLLIPSDHSTTVPIELSDKKRPGLLTIAHRGSSFSLPEHSIPAYRLALELGADYIEPDLVSTKDGRLVAVHNANLNITTNVAEVYPDRHREIRLSNGMMQSGYFVFDFTLEEVKALKVRQRVDGRSKSFDGLFSIPTLADIVDLLYEWNTLILPTQNSTKKSGIYVELKSPEIFTEHNISLVDTFIDEMVAHPHAHEMFFIRSNETDYGCHRRPFTYQVPPLVIQCFDGKTMKKLHTKLKQKEMALPPFVLLVDKKTCHLSTFWYEAGGMSILSGVGPDKECLTDVGGKEFMMEAKKFDLAVHPWTTRAESEFVQSKFKNAEDELRYLYCKVGIHGMFTENVNLGVQVGVRGCDDYKTAEEVLEEDIEDLEKEDGPEVDGAVSKKICNEEGNSIKFGDVTSVLVGGVVGMLGTLFVGKLRRDRKRKIGLEMERVGTRDEDMEII